MWVEIVKRREMTLKERGKNIKWSLEKTKSIFVFVKFIFREDDLKKRRNLQVEGA